MKLTRWLSALLACSALLWMQNAAAESEVYTMTDASGAFITARGGKMYAGDEYISSDNQLYRVISVDDAARTAVAQWIESAEIRRPAARLFPSANAEEAEDRRLICMYSTHSDESYVPEDGDYSLWEGAGIYDVGNALKSALEERGIDVVYSEETFHPHDADAYNRSRATAEELLKMRPDALLDIHRDAVPAEQYETTVDGEDISKVRLFVGRSNQNRAANKAFAQQIKSTADEKFPGLVKDIYIGKGNYNQELYPHALLLEFGTDKIEKEKAIGATKYIAEVLDAVLYGNSARAEEAPPPQSAEPAARGLWWILSLAVLAAAALALASTGRLGGMWDRMKRGARELGGGFTGKKKDGDSR